MWFSLSLDVATAWHLCYSSVYWFFWFCVYTSGQFWNAEMSVFLELLWRNQSSLVLVSELWFIVQLVLFFRCEDHFFRPGVLCFTILWNKWNRWELEFIKSIRILSTTEPYFLCTSPFQVACFLFLKKSLNCYKMLGEVTDVLLELSNYFLNFFLFFLRRPHAQRRA